MSSRFDRLPATPELMISAGSYFRIMVWAHMAAFTLPTPAMPITASWPRSLPLTKVILPITSVLGASMLALSFSASMFSAQIIPIILLSPVCDSSRRVI